MRFATGWHGEEVAGCWLLQASAATGYWCRMLASRQHKLQYDELVPVCSNQPASTSRIATSNSSSAVWVLERRARGLFVHDLTLATHRLAMDHFVDRARILLSEPQLHCLSQTVLEQGAPS